MTIYGYARVSTDGQTLDAQRAALVAAGAAKVFHETASGIKSDRKELAKTGVLVNAVTPAAAKTAAALRARRRSNWSMASNPEVESDDYFPQGFGRAATNRGGTLPATRC